MAKAREKFLSMIQEAVKMDFSNPLEKRFVNQIAVKLRNMWGKVLGLMFSAMTFIFRFWF